MSYYLPNSGVLDKIDLKIAHYSGGINCFSPVKYLKEISLRDGYAYFLFLVNVAANSLEI
ncbi:hypothetical protein DFO77_11136 [Marinilabilia salmonicolor]|uniref:Uncharacterized protein n=1 Tax=Marinilabilia salmonicolor TaxID=989 RepID=A0A368V2E9_9BACT|nr:hypothetical protein DFO77_11136 [Marinilabilia salmonicolor]